MCLGNICRSPFAAAILRQRVNGANLRIESAGFIGPGRQTPDTGQRAALRRGIDLSAHRSQLVTATLLQGADLVVVMDRAQGRILAERFDRRTGVLVLGDLDPDPIETRTIRDPYSQGDDTFDQVFARIERCVETLITALETSP
jgi:protein-tyrosine phosphatase